MLLSKFYMSTSLNEDQLLKLIVVLTLILLTTEIVFMHGVKIFI